MKRSFILPGVMVLFGWSVLAQDAASVAARQAAEERYDRMTADIQELQTANQTLQAKISNLEQEMADLRAAQSQANKDTSLQDDLRKLASKLEEVDRKREEDKAAIAEEVHKSITELEKLISSQPRPAPVIREPERSSPPPADNPPADDNVPAKGFVYTVQSGDSLSAIVAAYNKDFKSKGMKTITMRKTMQANPKVDWNRLRVGQKIVIPEPPQ